MDEVIGVYLTMLVIVWIVAAYRMYSGTKDSDPQAFWCSTREGRIIGAVFSVAVTFVQVFVYGALYGLGFAALHFGWMWVIHE